ncbi:MAG: chromosome segregation protein SMC [Pirellulales bacterium]
MLKALELSGFKSFADRTRLDFPPGISIVVGPNGSGKSNIVDAIKWVLGSQSAKSLRGKEMTDVIFNGCATRGPLGTGEATLTFNNDSGQLPIDAKEVHVTRRVYRSGEGEYLINRQPCRLRDIRELLAGTGITTEAYCIIEQGKVDALLQASPRDRRLIFEEAAGISQFKAKKLSSLRRLERVEQNLLRLSDIVNEVEGRVRSVRSQAGRARRYRESADRLQQLRTEVGLIDWRALTQQISARDEQMSNLVRRQEGHAALLEQSEAQAHELDQRVEIAVQRLREIEAAAATTREQLAAGQATIDHQRTRRADLQQDVARIRQQLAAMSARARNITEPTRDPAADLQAAEAELAVVSAAWRELLDRHRLSQRQLEEMRAEAEETGVRHADALRSVMVLRDQITQFDSQLATAATTRENLRIELANLSRQREEMASELANCERTENELAAKAQSHQASLIAAERQLEHVRRELVRGDKQHRQLEGRQTRTRERIAVLSELEVRLEGLDGGVQQVLKLARDAPDGPFGEVCGVVADLFHVDVDSAPLIEVALGERAQFIVLPTGERLLEHLKIEPLKIGGRIGFLRLDNRVSATALDSVELSSEAGVMGRADRFVETAPQFAPLARRLLGRTWLVDRLSTALRLSQSGGRGLDFVTSDGELLAADGTLVVGPRRAVTGMLSRRSELRACHQQVVELEKQLAHYESLHERLDQDRLRQEALVASSTGAHSELLVQLSEHRQKSAVTRGQAERVAQDKQRLNGDLDRAEQQLTELVAAVDANQQQQIAAVEAASSLQSEVEAGRHYLADCEQLCGALQSQATDKQVAAAKCEQRVEMLRHQVAQAERSRQERKRAVAETRHRLAARRAQLAELDGAVLLGRQALAELFLQKERRSAELALIATENDVLRRQRTLLLDQINSQRKQLAALQSQQHKLEVATSRLHHERQTLRERMQEDYGIDLAEAEEAGANDEARMTNDERDSSFVIRHSSFPAPIDRDAVEREIAELRDQINNMGAVNLEALDELESLEERFGKLSEQYRDLVEAKASLERIIQRINTDSRQLFLATLETIRGHFQDLFRRLFGGGEADIVVDEAEDVLECGIEIVARPPGKEACIISLLSGGEKTLTCVAMLLAVFRSKPSPFCVLDEVDAALDEANIGRFIGVLREFLSFTQFVVISHSKKTMSGADTLYGVTMEESGVSKRVSVRFEDVSEDGHILPSAIFHAKEPEQATQKRAA